jgi:hypothetical protein
MGPNFQVGFLKLKEAQSAIQHFFFLANVHH